MSIDFRELDIRDHYRFFTDFDEYAAGDWVITTVEAGAGSATEALEDAVGGVLVVTNDSADNDSDAFQWAGGSGGVIEAFKFTTGKRLYFGARFKVDDATESDLEFGLLITDTTPFDTATDGIYFRKDDGDTNLDFVVKKNSTDSTVAAIATISNDTWVTVEFYYNGSTDRITALVNGIEVAGLPLTNAPDDEELAVSFGIRNGSAAARTLRVDWLSAIQER